MRRVLLYCDGSVRTGGRAGIGVVIATEDGMPLRRFGEALSEPHTVNTAEYTALIRGLEEALKMGATEVECFVDSTLVHGQLTQGWACNHEHLRALRDEARELLSRFSSWTLERIESEQNRLAHCYAEISSTQNRRRFFRQHPRRAVDIHSKTQTEGGTDTMKLVVTTQALAVPDDVYVVSLVDVQQQTGAYGEQLVWRLRVAEGEFAGTELRAWTNCSSALNAKAIRWASAFAGEAFTAGDVVDLDALKGKRARAIVQSKQTADGRTYARVTDILPLKRAQVRVSEPDDPFEEED